jgi:hypothetical protein
VQRLHNDPDDCAAIVLQLRCDLLAFNKAIATRLQRACNAIAARSQRDRNVIAMRSRLQSDCSTIATRLQRDCNAIATRLQRDCNAIAKRLPSTCATIALRFASVYEADAKQLLINRAAISQRSNCDRVAMHCDCAMILGDAEQYKLLRSAFPLIAR